MSGFFVAEDVTHTRAGSRSAFVSRCGYIYDKASVDWAGDWRPEAWEDCVDCAATQMPTIEQGDAPIDTAEVQLPAVAAEATTHNPRSAPVRGVYALEDHAHLWVARTGTDWDALCGRSHPDVVVAWADDEWPDAYTPCPECVELAGDEAPAQDETDKVEPEWCAANNGRDGKTRPLQSSSHDFRIWVLDEGVQHRLAEPTSNLAMCDRPLISGSTPYFKLTKRIAFCAECDRVVGEARSALREQRTGVRRSAPKTRQISRNVKVPRRKARRRAASKPAAKTTRAPRKMVVPRIRFVSGGAPGLGKRR